MLIDREHMPITLVGSQSIYYDDYGSGHRVLLITGLGASRLMWWKQIEIISRKYRLINMDNRDAGDSAPGAGPYTIADMADDAAGLIRNLKCGPAHVIGWSMGGFIAMELSLRHPGLVGKLILVATSAGGQAYIPPAHEVGVLLLPHEKENLETVIRRVYPSIAAPGYMNSHPEDLDTLVRYFKSKPMTLASYQRQLGATMTWPGMVDRMSRISMPTLVVHGVVDPLVPYGNGLYLSTIIRGAKLLTYTNVGHLPPIEASERFNQDAIEFLG
ncbi:MAG: alpha/beta fold hydrolase [Syntrophobacteraceae bacterium]